MMKKFLTVSATLLAPAAMAHTGHDGGLAAGLAHPLTGWDHLLAMVAVGMLAVQMKGRALWLLPAAFVAALAAGAVMGLAEMSFGPVEGMIAASLVVLGGLLAARRHLPLLAGVAVAGVFGLFHGFAHGLEAGGAPAAFLLGMVVMSALLHGAGIVLMRLGHQLWAQRLAQAAGAAMALAGGVLMMG